MPVNVGNLVPASLKSKEVATQEYVDTTVTTQQDVSDSRFATFQGFASFDEMVSEYSLLGSTVISGGYLNTGLLKADSVTTKNLNIDDTLTVNSTTGSFSWGKTSYNDFTNIGCWMGNYSNNGVKTPGFSIGGANSYIIYDGENINIVNAKFSEYAVHETTVQYVTPGVYVYQIPPEALSLGSMDIELSGGGGGGGGGGDCRRYPASGSAGGNTTVEIINGSTGAVRQTIVALGGAGGTPSVGEFRDGYRSTKGQDFSAYGGDSLFIGHVGGATTIHRGFGDRGRGYNGTGYSTGGGGGLGFCTQYYCRSGYGGNAGNYNALLRYDPIGATDYLRITVGAGGIGGNAGGEASGLYGGNGAGGAVKITVREVM